MDKKISIKGNKKSSIAGMIIITCLLAVAAIFLSLYVSRVTFGKILSTVDQLAKPNAKIQLVNDLFRDVVKLDHLQRNQALKTEHTQYNPFLKESQHLQDMLDTLHNMSLQNKTQLDRIDSMKKILHKRDQLFLKYIKLRTVQVQNDTLASQVKNLSEMIEKTRVHIDSNRITTSRATKTTIDTLKQEEKKLSLWHRVFSKRKPKVKEVQKKVEEELKVRVDTVGLENKADSLEKIGKAITAVETNRLSRRTLLRSRQAELNLTGDILVAELISILNDIERDELASDANQNLIANQLVNKGLKNISAILIIFISGIAILVFLIFADISRSNQYRKQLIAAKEEAEEAGLVKQRFLANMSHELRTPLQTIIGISEQVRAEPQPKQQDLENIHLSSLHLLQIVNEVLDYSRIISGKYILEHKPFNMRNVLDEVKEMIQVQLALKNLSFHYDVNVADSSYYSGDAFRLKQVLLNMLGNAIKFTGEGSVSLSVTEQEQPDGRSLFTFIIKDTGIGISAADLAIIFNEFEQGSDSRKKHGTGLGLSIVKAMVDIQHGTIEAHSGPDKGTTFTITLPYEKTNEIVQERMALPVITGYSGHVWIIDDDMFILQLCDSILNKYNIPHTCFSSAQLAAATEFPPMLSVVFLDIRMEEMDGIILCNKFRKRAVLNPPLYIALTAQAFPDEQEDILQEGFDGLVVKPFLERDLIAVIPGYTAEPETEGQMLIPNLAVVRKMTGDDEAMFNRVLQSFITETEADIATAKQSILDNDSYTLAEALHKLAGRSGQIGVAPLANRLRGMEIALNDKPGIDEPGMNDVFDDLQDVILIVKELLINKNIPT